MFKLNDYVVYGSTGVCQITDTIKDKHINDEEIEYYVLHPVFNDNMTIKVPIANSSILMRSVITKDDVLSLIAAMPGKEPLLFDDKRQRSKDFKAVLKQGNHEEWIKIIKTLYLEKKEKSAVDKKLTKSDEDIMNTAERQLYEEFAIALNISPDEVVFYILEHISKN